MELEGRWEERRTDFLAGAANWIVVVVEDNTHLLHEAYLLFIVALKIIGRGVGAVGGS